ncbi:hypothetical protein [Microcoleus sp. PH2017_09_SFU_O_A]|nr:hypothetical protein [Microcoleus sp. PH2017_09_SFU_O_A]MCC3450939.1 hypothetical protein [Microcoleus sp. PH2017_09_SFU_O_A]
MVSITVSPDRSVFVPILAYRREAPRSIRSRMNVGMKAERIDDCSRAT